MKAFAARPRDAEDIRQLAKVLDLHTVADVLASVHEIFPDHAAPGKPVTETAEGIFDARPVEQRRGIAHAASIS